MFDLERIKRGFERSETALFPEWLYAGMNLRAMNMKSVSAGVYGEILGGHYGIPMLLRGRQRAFSSGAILLQQCFRLTTKQSGSDVETFLQLRNPLVVSPELQLCELVKPRYLSNGFCGESTHVLEAINEDISSDVQRLQKRGVTDNGQLIEAFITEHRGTQYICAQMLNCRATVDVTLPYANRTLLRFVSQIPLPVKFNNAMNRAMIQKFAPHLLRYPTAAMLIPAGYPIVFQEATRFCRRILNQAFWRSYFLSCGRVGPLRTGWVNFEYLRGSQELVDLVNDLRCNFWDKSTLNVWLSNAARFEYRHPMLLLLQPLFRVYTVDLMLRN
jgi:hypothetical protein